MKAKFYKIKHIDSIVIKNMGSELSLSEFESWLPYLEAVWMTLEIRSFSELYLLSLIWGV